MHVITLLRFEWEFILTMIDGPSTVLLSITRKEPTQARKYFMIVKFI